MMRIAIALAILLSASSTFAQGMKDMDMKNMPMKSAFSQSHRATGVVKGVDAKTSAVTLAHEPVASLKWPAMTMTFKVDDPKLLDGLTVGKKVDVEFKQIGNDYVITSMK